MGQSFFQHALLLTQDLGKGVSAQDDTDVTKWFQNWRVYVGDYGNHDTKKNKECRGGPFMHPGDFNSYVYHEYNNRTEVGRQWKYGAEVWCNL